ncbi:MAG: hypothetical protein J3R72DRAFT_451094 [Linnemannia gamsii]|nr:MAG: hypothetical protein J3R72DRAFT_451094 [Linnemannia gamsii]
MARGGLNTLLSKIALLFLFFSFFLVNNREHAVNAGGTLSSSLLPALDVSSYHFFTMLIHYSTLSHPTVPLDWTSKVEVAQKAPLLFSSFFHLHVLPALDCLIDSFHPFMPCHLL